MADIYVRGDNSYIGVQAPTDWLTAADASAALGGHLVTTTSLAEAQFVNGVFPANSPSYWIGLTDAETEGTFTWITGEPLTYVAWLPGEPNDVGGNEDYVAANRQLGWNDIPGTVALNYVIEFEDAAALAASDAIAGRDQVFGSDEADILQGGQGRDTLFNSAGNDVFAGGGGSDTFVFRASDRAGADRVRGYQERDVIRLEGYGLDFDEVLAASTQQGDDVLITLTAGQSILLRNTLLSELDSGDFVFA